MRVLAATWDLPGHFYPLVPLGWALRAAGHEVVVVSSPGLAETITRAGLPALAAGPAYDSYAVLRERLAARKWSPTVPARKTELDNVEKTRRRRLNGFRIAADSAAAQAKDALAFAREWRPDIVLYEPAGFLGPLVARLLEVPAVRLLWSVDFTASLAEFEADVVGDLAGKHGLTELGVNGDLTLDPCPPAMQFDYPLERQRFRFVPYNGAATLRSEVLKPPARPRVCVTWGTSQNSLGFNHMNLAPRVVEALADLDIDVVVAVLDEQRELFGELPRNVSWIGRVPLHPLLETCDVLIQQGGAGGTMTGLIDGTAQLVIPHLPDEQFHGWQIDKGGAGMSIQGAEATKAAIRDAVVALLERERYRERAEEFRADMLLQPSPSDLVDVLRKWATR